MDYTELITDQATTGSPVFRKDRHLSSALVVTEIEYMFNFRDNPHALKKEHKMLLEEIDKHKIRIQHPEGFYSWCMGKILGLASVYSKNLSECQTLMRISLKGTELARKDWTGYALPPLLDSQFA